MIGRPDVLGVAKLSAVVVSRTLAVLRKSSARIASPRSALTSKPASTVASEAVGDGPENR